MKPLTTTTTNNKYKTNALQSLMFENKNTYAKKTHENFTEKFGELAYHVHHQRSPHEINILPSKKCLMASCVFFPKAMLSLGRVLKIEQLTGRDGHSNRNPVPGKSFPPSTKKKVRFLLDDDKYKPLLEIMMNDENNL